MHTLCQRLLWAKCAICSGSIFIYIKAAAAAARELVLSFACSSGHQEPSRELCSMGKNTLSLLAAFLLAHRAQPAQHARHERTIFPLFPPPNLNLPSFFFLFLFLIITRASLVMFVRACVRVCVCVAGRSSLTQIICAHSSCWRLRC